MNKLKLHLPHRPLSMPETSAVSIHHERVSLPSSHINIIDGLTRLSCLTVRGIWQATRAMPLQQVPGRPRARIYRPKPQDSSTRRLNATSSSPSPSSGVARRTLPERARKSTTKLIPSPKLRQATSPPRRSNVNKTMSRRSKCARCRRVLSLSHMRYVAHLSLTICV